MSSKRTTTLGAPIRRRASVRTPGRPVSPAEEWRDRIAFRNPQYAMPSHALTHTPFTGDDAVTVGLPIGLGLEAGMGTTGALAVADHVHPATIPETFQLPDDPASGLTVWDTAMSILRRWDGAVWTSIGPLTVEERDGWPSWPETTNLLFAPGALDTEASVPTVKPGAGLIVRESDDPPAAASEIQVNPGGLINIGGGAVKLDYIPASQAYGTNIQWVQQSNSEGSTAKAARSDHQHGLAHKYVDTPSALPSISPPNNYIGGLAWCASNDDWYSYRTAAFNAMGSINGGFSRIAPVNKLTGFGISKYYSTAICATYDGGKSWVEKQRNITTPDNFGSYQSIAMLDAKTGLAGCQFRGGIIRTTDGWNTFTIVQSNPSYSAVADIRYQSDSVVWAVGSSGFVWRSIDGGATWTLRSTLPGGVDANAIAIPDPTKGLNNTILVVAADDGIYRSTDSGLTWTKVVSSTDMYYDVEFATPLIGYATTYRYVKKTTDGGVSWTNSLTFGNYTCKRLWCVSSDIVYVSVYIQSGYCPYMTTDGGAHWTALPGYCSETLAGVPLGYIGTSPRTTIYGDELWSGTLKKTSPSGGWTGMHDVENVWHADAYFLDDLVISDTTDDLFLHVDPFDKSISIGGYMDYDSYDYTVRIKPLPNKRKGLCLISDNIESSFLGIFTYLVPVGSGGYRNMESQVGYISSMYEMNTTTGPPPLYSVRGISYNIELLDSDNTTTGGNYHYFGQDFGSNVGTGFFGSGNDTLFVVASNNQTLLQPAIYKPSGNMAMKCYGGSFYFTFIDADIDPAVTFTADSTMIGYYLYMSNAFSASSFAPPVYGLKIDMSTQDDRDPPLGINCYGAYANVIGNGVTNWSYYAVNGDWAAAADNMRFYWGADRDASIRYDGSDLVINPREVGTGIVYVQGPIRATEYRSSDNTVGITVTRSWGTSPEHHTVTVKNGIITSWVVS